ncbi:MAG: phosphatidate cytidylyltransferase [Rickettsiales bacterium]|jgi:phosphatidate cytidylyltransferase|nr:phosphatidate cytidylyltransferase [Rickettsiales bacterium]
MVYKGKISNFTLRLISACILAPLVLLIINLSGFYFTTLVLAIAIIMGGEWLYITEKKNNIWKISGVVYILLASISLLWIIQQDSILNGVVKFNGVATVISIFVLVWANDIGGYIFGKLLGGKKLCPKVSPNKTWFGFFGGILCSVAISPVLAESMITGVVVAVFASIGDLIESWAKRKCDVKNSGSLIPGHGGLLDRLDGVLLVAILVALGAICLQ